MDDTLRDELLDKYLPDEGEGKTMATQAVTAMCKIVYRWYNDGDVFDNTYFISFLKTTFRSGRAFSIPQRMTAICTA